MPTNRLTTYIEARIGTLALFAAAVATAVLAIVAASRGFWFESAMYAIAATGFGGLVYMSDVRYRYESETDD